MPRNSQCLLVDVIVCWRTWELWRRDSRILVWPMACISGGLGGHYGIVCTHCAVIMLTTLDSVCGRDDVFGRDNAPGHENNRKHDNEDMVWELRRVHGLFQHLFGLNDRLEGMVSLRPFDTLRRWCVESHARTRARALKRFNMHLSGGTYFRVLILIIESGILYSMALVSTRAHPS